MPPVIRLDKLTKHFGAETALDQVSLEVPRGTGLAVAAGASQRCREERVELIRTRLEQVFAEARQSRIDPRKLRTLVEQQLAAIEVKEK